MANDSVTIDLLGDNSNLDKSIGDASSGIDVFSAAIPVALGTAVAGAGLKIVEGIVGAFETAYGMVKDFIGESFALLGEQQASENKLEAVLEATGHAAGFTADQLKAMASQMQAVTTVGDESILNAQAIIATFKNIKGDEFRDATMAALDLSTVLGTDAKGAAMQLAKALNDPLKGLTRLADAGVSFSEEQKKQVEAMVAVGDVAGAQRVILDELAGEFGGAATKATEGLGAFKQFENTIGDVKEGIAAGLMPVLESLTPLINGALNVVVAGVPVFQEWIKNTLDVGAVIDWLTGVISDWTPSLLSMFTVTQTVFGNLTEVIEFWGAASAYEVIKFSNEVEYYFTSVIPGYIMWFADNWKEIFLDMYEINKTIYDNMFKNVQGFFMSLWDLLAGNEANFEFTALTDGFESSLKELPKIAEREIGAVEAELGAQAGRLGLSFFNKFQENLTQNKSVLDEVTRIFNSDGPDTAPPDLTPNITTDYSGFTTPTDSKDPKAKVAKDKADKDKKADKEDSSVAANVVALEGLADKIGGTTYTPAEQELITTISMSHDLTQAQTDALKESQAEASTKQETAIRETAGKQEEHLKTLIEKGEAALALLGQMLGVLPKVGGLK